RPRRCHRGGRCGQGLVCCHGVCVECCADTDCPLGSRCCQGICRECCDNADCPQECGACSKGACVPQSSLCLPCHVCNDQLACVRLPDYSVDGGCPTGQETCCGGRCVDLDSDRDNCGFCGIHCEVCAICDRFCKVPADDPCPPCNCQSLSRGCVPVSRGHIDSRCPGADICCDGACVDTQTNAAHCGRCGRPCSEGKICCDGECVDRMSNRDHCGGCQPCAAGETCDRGACSCGGQSCDAPFVCCESVCSECCNDGDCAGDPDGRDRCCNRVCSHCCNDADCAEC